MQLVVYFWGSRRFVSRKSRKLSLSTYRDLGARCVLELESCVTLVFGCPATDTETQRLLCGSNRRPENPRQLAAQSDALFAKSSNRGFVDFAQIYALSVSEIVRNLARASVLRHPTHARVRSRNSSNKCDWLGKPKAGIAAAPIYKER